MQNFDKGWFGLKPAGVRRLLSRQQQLQQNELERLEERKRLLQQELTLYNHRLGKQEGPDPTDEAVTAEKHVFEAAEHADEAVPEEMQAAASTEEEHPRTDPANNADDLAFVPEASSGEPHPLPSEGQWQERPVTVLRSDSAYWGDIDKYMVPSQLHTSSFSPPPPPPSPVQRPEFRTVAEEAEPGAPVREAITREQNEFASTAHELAAAVEDAPAFARDTAADERGSQAVSEEIRRLRYKYIEGKIAGDDLYDRRGELIIARNAIITTETVNKADREGKLADLIVSMIIPGLGEG